VFTHLIKTNVLMKIRKAIRIPKTIDTNVDDVEIVFVVFMAVVDIDDENAEAGREDEGRRNGQRTSTKKRFGGGSTMNMGGGGK
jgi:hypothetical protein